MIEFNLIPNKSVRVVQDEEGNTQVSVNGKELETLKELLVLNLEMAEYLQFQAGYVAEISQKLELETEKYNEIMAVSLKAFLIKSLKED